MHSWVPVGHTDNTTDEVITSHSLLAVSAKPDVPALSSPFWPPTHPLLYQPLSFSWRNSSSLLLCLGSQCPFLIHMYPLDSWVLVPIKCSAKLFQVTKPALQPLFPKPNHYFPTFSEPRTQFITPGEKHILFKVLPLRYLLIETERCIALQPAIFTLKLHNFFITRGTVTMVLNSFQDKLCLGNSLQLALALRLHGNCMEEGQLAWAAMGTVLTV